MRLVAAALGLSLAACSGNDPGPDTSIHGSYVGTYHADDGATDVPANLLLTRVAAHVWSGTAWTTVPGTGAEDGTFEIGGVPPGEAYVQVGKHVVKTTSRELDFGYEVSGRSDYAVGSASTGMELDVGSMQPWNGDALFFYSSNVGLWRWIGDALLDTTNPPSNGDTALTGMIDSWWDWPLVEAAKGDRATLVHYGWSTSSTGESYFAATQVFKPPPFTLADGEVTSLSGDFVDVPQDRSVSIKAWEAQLADFEPLLAPEIAPLGHWVEIRLGLRPPGKAPAGVGLPLIRNAVAVGLLQDLDLGSLSYGTPFSQPWPLLIGYASWVIVPASLPGTSDTLGIWLENDSFVPFEDGGGPVDLRVGVGPVLNPRINGQDAFHPGGVGLSPTIAWDPPAVGAPDRYRVEVRRYYAEGGFTAEAWVMTICTADTSVVIPPDTLQNGESYRFLITAEASYGPGAEIHPFRYGDSQSISQVVTALVQPYL